MTDIIVFGAVPIKLLPAIFFIVFLLLQTWLPRRELAKSGQARMVHNLLLFVTNILLMRFAVPLTLLSVAAWSVNNGFGVFQLIALPQWLVVLLCVVILDFAIYWQHVATHKFDVLWRMHKVHHADSEMDVTTAIRFHPIELVLSLFFKSAIVALLGAPLIAVIIFELLLFIGPAFNHSNVAIPKRVDTLLRLVIATPDTHRSHHSTIVAEQNTNYGFFLIWWDKLFATYTDTPQGGHVEMSIGLQRSALKDSEHFERVDQMLLAPFR